MTWVVRGVAVVALLSAACSAVAPITSRFTPQVTPTPTPAATATPVPRPTQAAPPTSTVEIPVAGQLAVLGEDGNLFILEQGHSPINVTSDAIAIDAQTLSGRIYQHPTWSPAGWLSYARAELMPDETPHLEVLAVLPDQGEPITVLDTTNANYVYGYWSPAPCASGPNCGRFAYLMNDGDRLALHLAEIRNGTQPLATDTIIGRAVPFYYSWAPDGEAMLWYQYEQVLAIYDIAEGGVREMLPDPVGRFMAPAWSPVDERLLFARAELDQNRMTIAQGSERIDLGLPVGGYAYFGWSPDGSQVAYTNGGDPLEPVTVIGADGSQGRVFASVPNVVAFFWSPDSTRLAVVSLVRHQEELPQADRSLRARHLPQQTEPGDFAFAWAIIDVASGQTAYYPPFIPTAEEWYMLEYFNQYAQSHRVWSPDSRAVVYAELDRSTGEQTIRLIDTQSPDQVPLRLAHGSLAVFSFHE